MATTDDKKLKIFIKNTVIILITDESSIQMICTIVKKCKLDTVVWFSNGCLKSGPKCTN